MKAKTERVYARNEKGNPLARGYSQRRAMMRQSANATQLVTPICTEDRKSSEFRIYINTVRAELISQRDDSRGSGGSLFMQRIKTAQTELKQNVKIFTPSGEVIMTGVQSEQTCIKLTLEAMVFDSIISV